MRVLAKGANKKSLKELDYYWICIELRNDDGLSMVFFIEISQYRTLKCLQILID